MGRISVKTINRNDMSIKNILNVIVLLISCEPTFVAQFVRRYCAKRDIVVLLLACISHVLMSTHRPMKNAYNEMVTMLPNLCF